DTSYTGKFLGCALQVMPVANTRFRAMKNSDGFVFLNMFCPFCPLATEYIFQQGAFVKLSSLWNQFTTHYSELARSILTRRRNSMTFGPNITLKALANSSPGFALKPWVEKTPREISQL